MFERTRLALRVCDQRDLTTILSQRTLLPASSATSPHHANAPSLPPANYESDHEPWQIVLVKVNDDSAVTVQKSKSAQAARQLTWARRGPQWQVVHEQTTDAGTAKL